MGNALFSVFPNGTFVDLGLYQFGWEQCEPLHSHGPYTRNHYLFHYVISGSGTLVSTNSKGITCTHKIESGQGFLICPKQINTYYADDVNPWEYTWLEFDGLRVKETLELAGLSIDAPIYNSGSEDLTRELMDVMLYIVRNPAQSPFHLIGQLYLFVDYLTRSSSSRKITQVGKQSDFYVREVISFVEQNFQNNITIEDIAAFCNLNRSYLGKIFKNSVGKSPQEFLILYRMTKATELLKLTDLSIGDISTAVGYPNLLHFSRAFKNVYGISPRNWRTEHKLH